MDKAHFHLPGLFEFTELYSAFFSLWREHREWFYEFCDIASVYGAPSGCLWGGGRFGGDDDVRETLALLKEYGISPRLTFSNSLLREEHLGDPRCNELCRLTEAESGGVIVHSDLLLDYLRRRYPGLYFVSSTTKVLTDRRELLSELRREEFRCVVPDFRLNGELELWQSLPEELRGKVEFLCNECCFFGCRDRKACYENVSRRALGEDCPEHICKSPGGDRGYRFSAAMDSPAFIGIGDIKDIYLPMGFSEFKLEGRGLGSAVILEFLLHYLTRPEYQLKVRESIYLDSMLDLF